MVLSNERTLSTWAHPVEDAPIRAQPQVSSRALARTHLATEDGYPEVYLLLRAQGAHLSGGAAPSPEATVVAADERRRLLGALESLPEEAPDVNVAVPVSEPVPVSL